MSENTKATMRAEITVRNLKTGRVSVYRGRYGLFYECVGYARRLGFAVLQYTAIA